MGMIKRALQRTSRKLLAKIIPPTHSHQLVLNPSLEVDDIASPTDQRNLKKLASLQRKFRKSSKDTAMAEALLLAVKNHLPAVQFHHIHGPNVQLSKNKFVARRTQSFCQALVFSNRVILPNERVYIKVLEVAKGWSGTIRFGFTAVDPATLACRMPKHACPDMTNAGHTWARALADEVVRRNSVIHFSYNKNGLIHYGINNQDCGVFHANVGTNQNLWFIVDIYGLTAAVELIDPRVNSSAGSSEIDISRLDGDSPVPSSLNRSTMFKSTSAMDELFGRYPGGSSANEARHRKKQSRKQAARHAALIQSNWAFENSIGTQFLGFSLPPQPQAQQCATMQLPNLNSINLPSAQQNIYSPMPNMSTSTPERATRPASDLHDYHQIYTSNKACPSIHRQVSATRLIASGGPTAAHGQLSSQQPSNASTSFQAPTYSTLNNSTAVHDLSQRLENVHLSTHEARTPRQQQSRQQLQHSTPKTSRTATATTTPTTTPTSAGPQVQTTPVASTRKRLQQQSSSQTNLKKTLDATDKMVANRSTLSKSSIVSKSASGGSQTNEKSSSSSKTRHSIKNQKSLTSSDRDKNNNSPPTKDCPICFERPINCVLYQCGHMCTCYECGVKQWKTQSRTCPICRTIIKDVIKTYMS